MCPGSGSKTPSSLAMRPLDRIAFYLIQIEGNQRPAQAGNIAVALKLAQQQGVLAVALGPSEGRLQNVADSERGRLDQGLLLPILAASADHFP